MSSVSASASVSLRAVPRFESVKRRFEKRQLGAKPSLRVCPDTNTGTDTSSMRYASTYEPSPQCQLAGMCLAPVIRPDGPAPKGHESLAQGLPWVSGNKRFALKGLKMLTRSDSKI